MSNYSVWLLSFADGKCYVFDTHFAAPEEYNWTTWKYKNPELHQAVLNAGGIGSVRKTLLATMLTKDEARIVKKAFIRYLDTCAPNGYNRHRGCPTGPRILRRKPVAMLDNNGEVLAQFSSVTAASIVTKINKSDISRASNGIIPKAGGYHWRKADKTAAGENPAAFLIAEGGERLDTLQKQC